jgi:lipopolysaccharide/colanic/teichoic acid biosynthesis glycosyltransferase
MSNIVQKDYVYEENQSAVKDQPIAYIISKRFIDIIGSIAGIILLSFLFILVAILIKIEDPQGPVFFTQKRVGLNGKEFKMFKFRSMIYEAEDKLKDLLQYNEVSGAMFKIKDDPRVTKVGRLIRKTSIDELPQLLNVLRGEMSLVGPRPPLPREVEMYSSYDKLRLLVTPGCTGLWQVSGRSNLGFNQMVELDLEYIKKRSLLFDVKIIIKTVLLLLGSKDAY